MLGVLVFSPCDQGDWEYLEYPNSKNMLSKSGIQFDLPTTTTLVSSIWISLQFFLEVLCSDYFSCVVYTKY